MKELTGRERITIARIIRVNHAGETGAIRIYAAQLWRARRSYPDMVRALDKMRKDEIRHCAIFRDAMNERETRPCRVMALWSLGGFVIGFCHGALRPQHDLGMYRGGGDDSAQAPGRAVALPWEARSGSP